TGTAKIQAVSGFTGLSGLLTVTTGGAATVTVETAPDGSGTVVAPQNVVSGSTVTVYAIQRDASGNFLANATANWSLVNVTGGVVSGDLAPATGQSATFTGHLIGSAKVRATVSALFGDSGTLTVTVGAAAQLRVETAANGLGTILGPGNIPSGLSLTGYSIS